MWIVSTTGFFSVVASTKKNEVMVRARKRSDLVALQKRFGDRRKILRTPKNDYLYRIYLPLSVWSHWLSDLAMDSADYPNFKHAVKRQNVQRASTYSKVWDVCREIETEDGRRPSTGWRV